MINRDIALTNPLFVRILILLYDRLVNRKRNKKYRDLSEIEEKSLEYCGCPICEKEGIEILRKDFCARALHNSWFYQKEIEKVRRLIKERSYEDYAEEVLSISFFSKAFAYAKNLRNS